MPYIAPQVAEDDLSRFLQQHLTRTHQGKVRDTYEIPDHPDLMLVVATDRISIFDYVLNARVPGKGRFLTKQTVEWLTRRLKGIEHHLVAYGRDVFRYLPPVIREHCRLDATHLEHFPFDLDQRGLIVMKLEMQPLEAIARGNNTGSGHKEYLECGSICGVSLPSGMIDGDELPFNIFTPSTKADDGHDLNISEREAARIVGWPMVRAVKRLTLVAYGQGRAYGMARGVVVADTKFEFGRDKKGVLRLADEVLTPDSSRFWPLHIWCTAPLTGRPPAGFDKEPVRQAGKKAVLPDGTVIDISGPQFKDPTDPANLKLVESWQVPEEVLTGCSDRYGQLEQMME